MIYSSCRLRPIFVAPEKEKKYLIRGRYNQSRLNIQIHKENLSPKLLVHQPYQKAFLKKEYSHINFDLPWIVEFCSGTGEFLIELARTYSQYFFIGVEVTLPCIQRALKQIGDDYLPNLLFYYGEGKNFITHDFKNFKFSVMMINFPDPWPKKRHLKRRIVSSEFITSCKKSLLPKGSLYTATDVEYLFNYHKKTIDPILTPCSLNQSNILTKPQLDKQDKQFFGHSTFDSFYTCSSRYQEKNLSCSQKVFYTHHQKS